MNPPLPDPPPDMILPRWGDATLSDIGPAVLDMLGVAVPTQANPAASAEEPLQFKEKPRYVIVLIDGLGAVDLAAHADAAPCLNAMTQSVLTAGFPSTTVTSLTSLATGLTPGQHGLPGYTTWEPDRRQVLHWLGWHPIGSDQDLREELAPEIVQPHPTIWETAANAGVATTVVNARHFEGTGLTRAAFRGGRYAGVLSDGDAIATLVAAADRGYRSLTYGYLPQLDLMGHVRGPGSDAWINELSLVDRFVEVLRDALPEDACLIVTGDHGMVELDRDTVIDADGDSHADALRAGVEAIAGEPRMRHVHARNGATADVLAAWSETLGDRSWVLSGDEAVERGLFGPDVSPVARRRIGDVLAIARGASAVILGRRESRMSAMPGHHGSLTDRDLLVPLAMS